MYFAAAARSSPGIGAEKRRLAVVAVHSAAKYQSSSAEASRDGCFPQRSTRSLCGPRIIDFRRAERRDRLSLKVEKYRPLVEAISTSR